MATLPHFAAAAPLVDDDRAVRRAPANDVRDETRLSAEEICDALSVAGDDRTIHIEYVLIAVGLLAAVGLGLYRLLM
ncbi:hypothetical protein [Novosphingobium sp.]|jgi:hypothetical protein|uniref:hypothetical protein n=1 Tax=Novosphingobium sp. TaxID=1874826 RepID=UPI0031E1E2CA